MYLTLVLSYYNHHRVDCDHLEVLSPGKDYLY